MPNYVYKCNSCNSTLDIFHSFSDKPTKCKLCGAEGSLQRDYSAPIRVSSNVNLSRQPVGEVVRQHIEEAKEEVREEKIKLQREFEND